MNPVIILWARPRSMQTTIEAMMKEPGNADRLRAGEKRPRHDLAYDECVKTQNTGANLSDGTA